ncbi:MAG: hypothetical protein JWR80_1607 [Bradyrhizobium sp.]|nr:hypothetical protein [Bradyrhizobium sp.]
MPYGSARIIDDSGSIDTDPPTPVRFTPSLNPDVDDGDWVYFERRPGDPTRASVVRPASQLLVALATPDQGVTHAARRLLEDQAGRELDALKGDGMDHQAKTAAWAEMQVRMDALATALMERKGPAGVATIRATLAKSG